MLPFNPSSPKPKKSQTQMKKKYEIIDAPSPNFDERKRPIRFVILHYTGMNDEVAALNLLRDDAPQKSKYQNNILQTDPNLNNVQQSTKMNRVSSHYVVFQDGTIYKLVDETKRAWHAGGGNYGGEIDMNSASIGIEICNGGHDYGLPEFPSAQIDAVMFLVEDIKLRHGLDKHYIIGHSDWAPKRKIDPGEKFPWNLFAQKGISLSIPKGKEDNNFEILASVINENNEYIMRAQIGLKTIGYGVEANGFYDEITKLVIIAFQRRFRQSNVSGFLDKDTLGKIERLAKKVSPA